MVVVTRLSVVGTTRITMAAVVVAATLVMAFAESDLGLAEWSLPES